MTTEQQYEDRARALYPFIGKTQMGRERTYEILQVFGPCSDFPTGRVMLHVDGEPVVRFVSLDQPNLIELVEEGSKYDS